MPTREIYWNISNQAIMYIILVIALLFFINGLYKRYKFWHMGQEDKRNLNIKRFLKNILTHKTILRDNLPGVTHLMLFWGFILLFIATVIIGIEHYLHLEILKGKFYLTYSLLTDLFGLIILISLFITFFRRLFKPQEKIDKKPEDYIVVLLIAFIILTGFIIEGLRLNVTNVLWKKWSPVGLLFSLGFRGLSVSFQQTLHKFIWWIHVVSVGLFIAYIPYSKLFHIIAAPLNQIYSDENSGKILKDLDLDDDEKETFGVGEIKDFTWKQLLDLDACTRCGRCQNECPAYLSKKPLNPKEFIQSLKKNNQISPETIWSCTTCFSCQNNCPVDVEHIQKIVDMRRYLVLTEGEMPKVLQTTFRNLETNGNPWGIGWTSRELWAQDLGIIANSEPMDNDTILYWPGCFGAFDERNKLVSKALVNILKKANIKFSILGNSEKCCGDSVRRLGNEYLYQMLVLENIENMRGKGVNKIVTQCPHCYNTLKNEYPKFGGDFKVFHHTELIEELIKERKIIPENYPEIKVTYHDPCYLGRYNNKFATVRNIFNSINSISLIEMEPKEEKSFCCGAGGGRMWLEEDQGFKISSLRASQAMSTKAEVICTACPFCLTMLSDELKEKNLKVMDIAEIINKK
ncbi:MAG: hypothetical protein PWQ67_1809 [Clostridia bacterium]|nr:hypothetical protein [Clostridia bacterium]